MPNSGPDGRYLPRHVAGRLLAYRRQFPVTLIIGARQIGKSTLLANELRGWRAVDLESPEDHSLVAADVSFFLREHPRRVWFDEAQRLPELFPALRVAIDHDRRPGRYVLCGSASPLLMARGSESLAGRVGVLEMSGLTAGERLSRPPAAALGLALTAKRAPNFIVALERMLARRSIAGTAPALSRMCLVGAYPEIVRMAGDRRRWRWMDSYVRTVSERDLSELGRALRPAGLLRFLKLLAARQGQLLNVHELAQGFGCDPRTAAGYLDLLEATFLWRRLPPYHANLSKRQIKTPKGYVRDPGLAHHLLGLTSGEAARLSPHSGPLWEGWLVEEARAMGLLMEPSPVIHFWRTVAGAEIDLVVEQGDRLLPIKIKRGMRIRSGDLAAMRVFLVDQGERAPFGLVLHEGDDLVRFDERIVGVPTRMFLGV